MNGRMWCAAALAGALVVSSGCRHWCRRPCPPRSAAVLVPAPSVPGACPTCPPANAVLPPSVQPSAPFTPPPSPPTEFPGSAPSATPFAPSPPPSPPSQYRGQSEDFVWRPSPSPEPSRGGFLPDDGALRPSERESAKLLPPEPVSPAPQSPEPPIAAVPSKPTQPETATAPPMIVPTPPRAGVDESIDPMRPKPGVAEETPPPPTLPVDIPQYALAKKDVASGLKPYPDGLKWLADNGYRAVLHLRAPGEEDSGDRKLAEKNGLKYLSLEVSAENLSRELVEQFNAVIAEAGNRPLFVYDREGMVAGGLWYLHFRSVEGATDEDARTRAGRLGIKPELNGDHRTMWLAVQKVWATIKPAD